MQVNLQTVGDWQALRANTEQVAELVSEFLRGLGAPDKDWSLVASGSCLNVKTALGFLKIFSPFEDEVETRECVGLQLLDSFDVVPSIRSRVTACGLNAVLLDEVAGHRLDTIWDELDEKQRSTLLEALGNFCRDMHALEIKAWPLPSAQFWWDRNRTDPRLTRLQRPLVSEALGVAPPVAATLVHADLKREHIFVDNSGRLSGIVDFGDTEMAWPSYEAVTVALDVCERDRSGLEAFYRGLGSELVLSDVLRSVIAHRFAYLAYLAPELGEVESLELLESNFFLS